jgi:hypothetical protein
MELPALHTFALLNFYIDVQLYSMKALGMLYWNECINCCSTVPLKCYSMRTYIACYIRMSASMLQYCDTQMVQYVQLHSVRALGMLY